MLRRFPRLRPLSAISRRRMLLESLEDRTLLTAGLQELTPGTYVPGEILIGFEGEVESSFRQHGAAAALGRANSLVAAFNLHSPLLLAHQAESPEKAGNLSMRWKLPDDSDVMDFATRLSDLPGVAYAEPNYVFQVAATIPNDPQFSNLWGLHNTAQTVNGTFGSNDDDVDAPEAWDIATGSGSVVVGVIDTGVDYNHPDLAANIWTNAGEIAGNGIDDDANGFVDDIHGWDFANGDSNPFDDNGHGTHVAGTIAAVGNNGIGVVGASWNAKIMALKFLDSSGNGNTANAVAAMNYATMMRSRGVDIRLTNHSYTGTGFSQTLKNAIDDSGDAGMLVVAAAGNNNTDIDTSPFYPAAYDSPNIISVAATDQRDARASFSNFGDVSVDLGAPGVNIYSTVPTAGSVGDPSGYRFLDGTSMASPLVAGVASLAWSLAPAAGYQTIKDAILGGVDIVQSMTGNTVTGGRLNAFKTLQRIGMTVRGSTPESADIVTTPPTDFVIDFSQPVHAATLQPADLTVNLLPADSVSLLDGDTAVFHFNNSPVTGEGVQTMHMAAGAVATTSTVPLSPLLVGWNATFRYDALRMQVAATSPPVGGTISQDGLPGASLAVASMAGIDGGNGGWPVLYGAGAVGPFSLNLAIDEDNMLDAERSHTDEQVGYLVLDGNPSADFAPYLRRGIVSDVSNTWTTVTLDRSYASMVVVATPSYTKDSPPVVARVRNAIGNSFELMVARTDGLADPVPGVDVHYIVVEEGVYNVAEHGVQMEAVKYTSATTDWSASWVGESRNFANSGGYANPVVLGQVMSANDSNFSVFWAHGATNLDPPSTSALYTGKHVGEDPTSTRASETIGYIVIEGGRGNLAGTSYLAAVGTDTIRGMDDGAPFAYSLGNSVLALTVNEPVDSASIGPDDILLSQGTVLSARVLDATTIEYTLAFSKEEVLTVAMPAGALTDQFGNPIEPFVGSYFLDWDTIELPASFKEVIPAGSLVYDATHAAMISTAGDTDSFTFEVQAGQTIAAVVDPFSGLAPSIQLFGPSNELLASGSAGSGAAAAVQMTTAVTSGDYRITVSGGSGSTGDYSLRVILNAAVEDEEYGGAINDIRAAAQGLDAAFVDFGGVQRAVVSGQADGYDAGSAVTTTYAYPGSRVRIPDQGQATSTVTIADSRSIADLNVFLDISHAYDADLDVFLIAPDGTRVQLFNDRGSEGDNFTSTILDDEATAKIVDGSAPFTGRYRPEGRLSDFDGKNVQGTWIIEVIDDRSSDQGWLNSWSIEVTSAPQLADYYALDLAAGELATLTLTTRTTGKLRLELQNSAGAIVASGTPDSANVHLVIDRFSAPAAGQYYAVVSGNSGVDYSLMAIRDAAFDLEGNNDQASAQDVSGVGTIVGAIESPDPVFVPQGSGAMRGPIDILFGPDGNLYVSDFYGGFVHGNREFMKRYDGVTGEFMDTFAVGPAAYGEGMTFGPDGNLYTGGQRFDGTTGAFIGAFAVLGRDVVFGPDGNFYVSDITNDRVQRFNGTTGAKIDDFVTMGSGGLDFAWGLAFGPDGDLFVSSLYNSQILRYDGTTGAFLGVFVPAGSGGLSGPNMIAFGPDSNGDGVDELYVASGDVRRYDGATGAFLDTYVAGAGASGLTFGPDGSLYVTSGTGVSRYRAPLRDQYQFELTAGMTLNLATETPLGTLNGFDPRINVYSPTGALVAFDDDSSADGRNSELNYTATASGTYYVEIVPSPNHPNSTGEYILTVDIPPPPPTISIDDVARIEGNSGTTTFTFTVTRSGDSTQVVTLDFATSSGTATANVDYIATDGSRTFLAGETQKTIAITVSGDTAVEANETFFVNITNASANAFVADAQGLGTILDDDTKFYVVDDASANKTFEYSAAGSAIENYNLTSANSAPRGAASTAVGDKVWVVDANKNVYVYSASGGLLGSWTAGGITGNVTIEGIATNGTDIWIVDAKGDKVYRYSGAASRLSGSQNAASSFALNSGNKDPKDIVTDGVHLWVVNSSSSDRVFKYTTAGALVGSWTISTTGAASPTGITLDPANPQHLWIVDDGTDRVYQYDNAVGLTSGSQAASTSFALAAGNGNPQGIADPPVSGSGMLMESAMADLAPDGWLPVALDLPAMPGGSIPEKRSARGPSSQPQPEWIDAALPWITHGPAVAAPPAGSSLSPQDREAEAAADDWRTDVDALMADDAQL